MESSLNDDGFARGYASDEALDLDNQCQELLQLFEALTAKLVATGVTPQIEGKESDIDKLLSLQQELALLERNENISLTSTSTNNARKTSPAKNKSTRRYTNTPLICEICGPKFLGRSPSALKIHMRIHSGEKPYVCATCNIGFARNADLRKHNNTTNHHSTALKLSLRVL